MPVESLLKLPSIHCLLRPPGQRSAADGMTRIDPLSAYHRAVREFMIQHGRPEYPVHVAHASVVLRSYANMIQTVLALPEEMDSLWVGNGHRRLYIARELGWKEMICTADVFESGPEYEPLRGTRPKVFAVTREEALELYPASENPGTPGNTWVAWATAKFQAAGWGHLI